MATTSTWTPNGSETAGTAVTVGNSGGAHGVAWDEVGITAGVSTVTYETTAGRGLYSGRSARLQSTGGKGRLYKVLPEDTDDFSITWGWYMPSPFANTTGTPVAVQDFCLFDSANVSNLRIQQRTDGQLQVLDGAGTVRKTFNVASHIYLAGQLYRCRLSWHKGGTGVGKWFFGYYLDTDPSNAAATGAYEFEDTTASDNGTLQAHAFHFGANGSTTRVDMYLSQVTYKTGSYADISPAAPAAPVVTVMSTPPSRGAGTVTVTAAATVADGTIKTLTGRILTTAQGAGLAVPVIANPPNNPTISAVTNNLNTPSATASFTFAAIPGRYHFQPQATKNDDTPGNTDAWVVIDIYGASGQYEVKPFRVISIGGYTINGAADAVAALGDGSTASDVRITGPVNADIIVEMCAFGPDSIEFMATYDADTTPATTARHTVKLANGSTSVYVETPYTVSTSATPSDWDHPVVVDGAGLAIATPGDARRALQVTVRTNQ